MDAVNGVLTVDTEFVSFRWGDVNGISVGDYTRKMATGRLANYPNHKYTPVCNVAKYKAQFSEDSLHFYVNNAEKNNVIVFLPNDADEDTIVQVAYPLATPIEIQLDPITIQTLLGDNTIWSDANGTIELDYRADTKLFIAKQKTDIRATIAPIEDGTTASKAYSAGKFFYHDGNFCKAKTSIAVGAAFTLNTNYEITTVADELFALN